jgi:peptidoglycan/LPS O-acetylase OafA/YrhL
MSSASNASRPRYDSLDAWRGVACLMVIIYHSTLMLRSQAATAGAGTLETLARWIVQATAHGNAGVALFFVISGYCIAAAGDSVRSGRHSVTTYFLRRVRRIYPPLWAVIGLSCLFFVGVDVLIWPRLLSSEPWFHPRPWWYSGWQWLGNLTLTESWRWHVIGDQRAHFPAQAWTLCYEEQFYGVVGLLLAIGRTRFFSGAILVTVFTLGMMAGRALLGWPIEGFFFDGAWMLFAAGVLVYWTLHYGTRHARWWAGAVLVLSAMTVPAGPAGSTAAFAFAALLLVLYPFDEALMTSSWARPLIFCGQMCYSLYLVHELIVKAIAASLWNSGVQSAVATLVIVVPISLAMSVLAGALCYQTIERRFLNTPRPISLARRTPQAAVSRPSPGLSPS